MHNNSAWESLNDVQRAAASWDRGAMLVLAGPGSGKTRVLTCRIANLLDRSRNEKYRILGLTFTNKAAEEMRERLVGFIGIQEERLFLGTFHSFCADVLRQQGMHLDIRPDFKIYSLSSELDSVLKVAVNNSRKLSDKVSSLDLKLLPIIQQLQKNLITPEDAMTAMPDRELGERVSVVFKQYQEELRRQNALDFNSLICETIRLFRRYPALAKRYRTVYPYICVDEFQDTNDSQYQLLRALTPEKGANIFVVADDDQIIYQWNGASHQRISEFISDFTPEVLQLPLNYRCPREVIVLANNLISQNFLRTQGKAPLIAYRQETVSGTVRVLPLFETYSDEATGVATDIEVRRTTEGGTIAVLARRKALLERIHNDLQSRGIKSAIHQRKDEFQSTPIMWLHALLKLASNKDDQQSLEAICGLFRALTGCTVEPDTVVKQARGSSLGYLHHWVLVTRQVACEYQSVVDTVFSCLVEKRDYRGFANYAFEWFDGLSRQADGDPSNETFTAYSEERQVWSELSREVRSKLGIDATLEALLQELELHSKGLEPTTDCVQLMTIHASKGKEFDHVYIVGLVEDELPSFQSRGKGDKSPDMEEERRNCFVALTRAIKTLNLSYAKRYSGWPKSPSRFLYEMGVLTKD